MRLNRDGGKAGLKPPLHVPIPATRDPFVNTPLLSLGPDRRGIERFWISTWNGVSGTTGVLLDESGEYRLYRFAPEHECFYSAAVEDADTLWLCGNLDRVVRLSLESGACETFPTAAYRFAIFQGMPFDPATGKLFAAASPNAIAFDTRTRRTSRIYRDLAPDHYMRHAFPNADGTYTIVLQVPEATLLRWDPRTDAVEQTRLRSAPARYVQDAQGRWFFPAHGWYDPRQRVFESPVPDPEREMEWFARRGDRVYGVTLQDADAAVHAWDLTTGKVTPVCTIPNSEIFNMNLTASGKLLAVNMYGVLYRFDAGSGALELSKPLPTDAVGKVDCVCRIDADRLLGTPFITQRFWEANLRTGQGHDCGKAAPGSGEVLEVWNTRGKVYMAAYSGGALVEYDPSKPPRYPENPRLVAQPPDANRPVASATDGRHLFYACTAPYGSLGSVLAKYDTQTGEARYARDLLADQQICALGYDEAADALLCGTTPNADCYSAPAKSDSCYFGRINAKTLVVEETIAAPPGTVGTTVLGPLGNGEWLCATCDYLPYWCRLSSMSNRWFALRAARLELPPPEAMRPFPEGTQRMRYAGQPGLFVLRTERNIELWDMRQPARLRALVEEFDGYNFHVQDSSLYLCQRDEIVILEDFLAIGA